MRKKLLSAMVLALVLSLMFVGTAFANPGDAPGAGDEGDTANQATGQDPALDGLLNSLDKSGGKNGNGAGNFVEHSPVCAIHVH